MGTQPVTAVREYIVENAQMVSLMRSLQDSCRRAHWPTIGGNR